MFRYPETGEFKDIKQKKIEITDISVLEDN